MRGTLALPVAAHFADHKVDWTQRSLGELIDHIVQQHHAYLRRELPQLNHAAQQCDSVSSASSRAPAALAGILRALTDELLQHMHKEELVLFPWILRLGSSANIGDACCGMIGAPIQVMEHEHAFANEVLSRLRHLTSNFTALDKSSEGYRSLMAGLSALDADLQEHIHEENDILFPRALELESRQLSGV